MALNPGSHPRRCIERELGLVEEVAGEVAPRALEGEDLQVQRDPKP